LSRTPGPSFYNSATHCSVTGAEARAHDAAWKPLRRLRKAGRAFLLRLVAEYGPLGAARILRSLTDEIEAHRRAGEVSRFAPPAMPR